MTPLPKAPTFACRGADVLRVAVVLVNLTCVVAGARAQRPGDTVFVVPGSHLDIGFTAPIDSVRALRIAILDHAIALAEKIPDFAWFEEGGWSVEAWLDHYHGAPAQIARLRALVMRGRIGIGATLLSPHGAAFPQALRLLTLHLDRIQRELGRRPTVAVINDVPAVPEALVDALAAAGIRYLLMGPNLVFSDPLPAVLTRSPFYWVSSHGARVLVSMDPEGYSPALTRWLLPADCVRQLDPAHFPRSVSDDSILSLGVGRQLSRRSIARPLSVIQHAMDNGEPYCAANLAQAAGRWNRRASTTLVVAGPEAYFRHLEERFGPRLPARRGEWGGDWDLLRASEPVWSWRLREAIRALSAASPRDLRLAAATVTDHNVGLGPRWMDGLPAAVARQHIDGVADLYRQVVEGALGPIALTALPAPIAMPAPGPWPSTWRAIVGAAPAARVRAGPAFIYPFVDERASTVAVPLTIGADAQRLVIHAAIDRVRLEQELGARYQAVIEITLRAPLGSLTLAPEDSPSARAGRWLLGTPSHRVVAPGGVRITGPAWSVTARGPLIIGWTLVRDPVDPGATRLQALALVHAVEGAVTGGQLLRLPFAAMYPGEPAVPVFDLELRRSPR